MRKNKKMDKVPNRHDFCIFADGAEKIISLTDNQYYLYSCPPEDEYDLLLLSDEAFRLYRLQDSYLHNKQQQQAQKNIEALCFKFCAKHLPLTKDVINLICEIILSRPYDPKLAVALPTVQVKKKENPERTSIL